MKYIKLMALLLAVGLTACSSDDEVERGLLPEESSNLKQRPPFSDDSQAQRLIIVEVEENPLTDISAPKEEKMEIAYITSKKREQSGVLFTGQYQITLK